MHTRSRRPRRVVGERHLAHARRFRPEGSVPDDHNLTWAITLVDRALDDQ